MKKISILFFSLLAVLMFTACNNDDDPENIETYSPAINSRAINGDKVVFSQNTSIIEVNLTKMTVTITSSYKDCDGNSHKLNTTAMQLTQVSGYTFSFNSGSTAFGEATSLTGYIDLSTVVAWYSFTANGTDNIVCTTHPIYSYGTTTVTDPDNGNQNSYTNSQYGFMIDATGEKCTMVITYFAPNLIGAIQADQIYWENLKLTPTTTGYTITGDKAESSLKGTNTITDINLIINNQCRALSGSFKCNNLEIKVNSNLFPSKEL